MAIRNTFIIFLVSGFWHGANWTFVIWGLLNAIYMLPLIVLKRNRNHLTIVANEKTFPGTKDLLNILVTFALTTFAWIFFRAENTTQAFAIVSEIFSNSLFSTPELLPRTPILLIVIFVIMEWSGRRDAYAIEKLGLNWNPFYRWTFYYLLFLMIFMLKPAENQPFIYFQF